MKLQDYNAQGKAIHLNQMFTTSRVPLSLFLPNNAIT